MIKALAPRMPRGCSWVWLSIVLVGALPLTVLAQTTKKGSTAPADEKADTPKKGAAEKAKSKGEKPAKEAPAEVDEEKAPTFEVFKDRNTENALGNRFAQLPPINVTPQIVRQVREMAGGAPFDVEIVRKYVEGFAADLTNRAFIKAVSDNDGRASQAQSFRRASAGLVEPLEVARKANNAEFLRGYSRELIRDLPKLLDNHLLARMEAIIALGQTGSPEAVDIFIKQLNDPKQSVWVKLWAARGITNIVQTPTGNQVDTLLPGRKAIDAAKALSAFLNRDDETPWPAQMRALEALGALRLAADPAAQSRAEMADAAMRFLADPDARPEVRAQAAWALGMMRVSTAIGKFNFSMVAHYIGEVASDIGEETASIDFDKNSTQAEYFTALLVYQINSALHGQNGYRDSGLLNVPNLGNARAAANQVADLVRAVSKNAVTLIKGTKGQRPQLIKDLRDRVGALKTLLAKNPPADKRLVPGGREFPLQGQVAGAPEGNARVAGNAGAR